MLGSFVSRRLQWPWRAPIAVAVTVLVIVGSFGRQVLGQAGSPIELVSATPAGVPAGGQLFVDNLPYDDGGHSHLSADNRYVVFASPSPLIVAGDTNGKQDIFLRDRQTGITTLVSRGAGGAATNDHSNEPAISANGRYIAYTSLATNISPSVTPGYSNVFVYDRQTGTTSLVSVALGGGAANAFSSTPSLSADGRYIAFASSASNLIAGDTNVFNVDVFVRDMVLGTTERVSVRPDGSEIVRADSVFPSISADGQKVAFGVYNNILAGPPPVSQPNFHHGIYVRDRSAGTTTLVSARPDGTPTDTLSEIDPMISANGRYVMFVSWEDLDPNFPDSMDEIDGPYSDVFVRDLQTGVTDRVSLPFPGGPVEESGGRASISGNGRYVAYVANDNGGVRIRDRIANTTTVITAPGGVPADGQMDSPAMSEDGSLVFFESYATNLVPGDTNGLIDTFLFHMAPTADLSLTLTASTLQPAVGGNVTLTVGVTNSGPSETTGVAVRAPLPAGLTFVSATASAGSYSSATGIWTVGTLAAGATSTLQIVAQFTATSSVSVTAQVSASDLPDPDSTPDNSVASEDDQRTIVLTPGIADLSLTLAANTTTPTVNSNVTVTASLTNSGPATSTGAAVHVTLPASLTFVSATASAGTYDSATGTWTLPNVVNGATRTLQVVARVTNTTAVDVAAEVSAANESDPDSTPNNNAASEDDQASVHLIPAASAGIIVNDATPAVDPNDGKCTLIEAIIAANTDAPSGNALGECAGGNGADVIHLRALTPPYTLVAVHNTDHGANGLPPITSDITIDGADAVIQRLDSIAVPPFRLFFVETTGRLVLNHTVLLNGRALTGVSSDAFFGGAIFNLGRLELDFSAVGNSAATCDGGGIFSNGPLVLRNGSVLQNNTSGCSGGGVGTFYAGSVTIDNARFQGNSAPNGSGGGFYAHGTTTSTMNNTLVLNNTARLEGGGVFLHGPDSNLSISNTTISGNIVTAGSGGGVSNGRLDSFGTPFVYGGNLVLNNVTVENNRVAGGYGAGISNVYRLTATASDITDNQVISGPGCGGGIYNAGEATIVGTSVARNQSSISSGGGICSIGFGPLAVTNSTIASNVSILGGGVALFFSPGATFTNTTISSNTALGNGGGLYSTTSLGVTKVVLDGATIQQNSADAGGGLWILGGATTLQNNTRVLGNIAAKVGGGILTNDAGACCFATFTMTGGSIDGNTANGAIASNGGGGGIANFDTSPSSAMTLTGVTISNNHAPAGGNGGGIFSHGRLFMSGGAIRANDALSGGALSNGTSLVAGGPAVLTDVTVEDNVATSLGGAIFAANPPAGPATGTTNIVGGTLRNNRADNGGALFLRPNTTVTVGNGAVISGNVATTAGGGIYTTGTLNVSAATVANNTANFAGAVYVAGSTTIVDSTISGNAANVIGGISVQVGTATVRSSTISANRSTSTVTDSGGAFDVATGTTLSLASSTVAANIGRSGGINSSGTVAIDNSILAGNARPDGVFSECRTFVGATWTQQFNIIGQDPSCILSTTVQGDPFNTSGSIDPSRVFIDLIKPLANNGGPTSTHALVPGSLAIDGGNFTCPATDQRGLPRPVDGDGDGGARCDIGAFEQQTPLADPLAALVSMSPSAAVAGGAAISPTLIGTGFAAGSTVYWNGAPRPTYVASPTRLTVVLPASDLATTADLKSVMVTVVNPGAGPSNALPFTIISPRVSIVRSTVVTPGNSGTATTAPTVAGQSGVTATLTNNNPASTPATVAAANYSTSPVVGTTFAAGGFFDVQVTGADPTDRVDAKFYYPSTILASVETTLVLRYWNGTALVPVIGSGGAAPIKDTTNNLDGTVSGGRFSVTFDATSVPSIMDLSGTVFAIVEDTTTGPPVTTATESPSANAAGWHNTSVFVTLKATVSGATIARTEYNLDDRGWKTYTMPVSVLSEGVHTLNYRSITTSGVVEVTKALTIKIDKTPPTLRLDVDPVILWPADGKLRNITVDARLKDSLSGADKFTLIAVDSNHRDDAADIVGWSIGTPDTSGQLRAKFTGLFNPRIYRLTYKGVDKAGNETIECVFVLVLQIFGH
jgi:uncharacterized repeat protein (TIGR01451 family)